MKLIQAIESLTRWAGWVGAILIFPLVGALVVEVFSRYVIGRPTLWAFEISYMVMGAMCIANWSPRQCRFGLDATE